jgi:hypothetical protein
MANHAELPVGTLHRIHPLATAISACLKQRGGKHLATAAGLALVLASSGPVQAATYTVTNTSDAGLGSLRQAVLNANANPGADIIVFDSSVSGTISLISGEMAIADSVTINGPGPETLSIDAAGASDIFVISASSPVTDIALTVSGLSLTNATAAISASVYDTYPTVTVTDSVISGNAGTSVSLYTYASSSTLTVSGAEISGNAGHGIDIGTGRYAPRANAFIEGVTIAGNEGVGIRGFHANVEVTDSTISDNSTGLEANGYWDYLSSSFQVTDSVISGNAGPGVDVYASGLSMERTSVTGNGGAGVLGTTFSSTEIVSSTIADNGGGGVDVGEFESGFTISNSTISGNQNGFGVSLTAYTGMGEVRNSTITANDSGGVFATSDVHHINLENTVVGGNGLGASPDLSGDGVFSLAYSLIQDDGGVSITETVPGSNIFNQDPLLGPLQNNGGPTSTHALMAGSPAIDSGDPAFAPPPQYDQRGVGYDRVVNGRIDMGAFEVQPSAPLEVDIDILPNRTENIINLNSRGFVQVAVLSASGFDASEVDPWSTRFGPDSATAELWQIRDFDLDGDLDLLVSFRIPQTGIASGDTTATLTGLLAESGVPIMGTDAIQTKGR